MPTTCTQGKIAVLILTILVAAVGAGFSQDVPTNAPYKDAKVPVETRVRDLLGRMTAEEKASLLSGANWMQSVAIPRLGIPPIKMADGPAGIRSWTGPSSVTNSSKTSSFTSTGFPSGIALA